MRDLFIFTCAFVLGNLFVIGFSLEFPTQTAPYHVGYNNGFLNGARAVLEIKKEKHNEN